MLLLPSRELNLELFLDAAKICGYHGFSALRAKHRNLPPPQTFFKVSSWKDDPVIIVSHDRTLTRFIGGRVAESHNLLLIDDSMTFLCPQQVGLELHKT